MGDSRRVVSVRPGLHSSAAEILQGRARGRGDRPAPVGLFLLPGSGVHHARAGFHPEIHASHRQPALHLFHRDLHPTAERGHR